MKTEASLGGHLKKDTPIYRSGARAPPWGCHALCFSLRKTCKCRGDVMFVVCPPTILEGKRRGPGKLICHSRASAPSVAFAMIGTLRGS